MVEIDYGEIITCFIFKISGELTHLSGSFLKISWTSTCFSVCKIDKSKNRKKKNLVCFYIDLITLLLLFESISGLDAEPVSAVRSAAQEAFISNRRPVTDDEIKNALALAQAGRTDDSLVVVMRPSHVYKRFFVVNICLTQSFII